MRNFIRQDDWRLFDEKSILVTGGTGSFGHAFVKYVLENANPRRLIVFSRDEQKHFEMAQKFSDKEFPCLRYFVGDVRDRERLELSMRGVDLVVHAAAQKHVPISEYNPTECIHTNILGAENVVMAALHSNVKKVIALSTDKAVNPVNLYGASKLASDKIFVAANNLSGSTGPRFSVVRYGNVIGSKGSVLPFFNKLIADGVDSLPVTDERMTRFWITLEQGVNFVVSNFSRMRGGEIFVPKIPSMRVLDMIAVIAPDLPYHVIGMRPGERLHEMMVSSADAGFTYEIDDRYVIEPAFAFWNNAEISAGETKVEEDFEYCSDSNAEWMSADLFREYLKVISE